jgi:hypothetical protein
MRWCLALVGCIGACSNEDIPPFPAPMHHGTPVDAAPQPPTIPGCEIVAPIAGSCGASSASSSSVLVSLAEQPVEGAVVATSRADGSLIASGMTDTSGCATVMSEPDALVTVLAPGNEAALYTTLAPASGTLHVAAPPFGVFHPPVACPTIAFRLSPGSTLPEGADYATLEVGSARPECSVFGSPSEVAWFSGGCLGTDLELDFQVLAWTPYNYGHTTYHVVSKSSGGRAALVNNEILFTPSWGAMTGPCPLAIDSSVPTPTIKRCTFLSDGVEFAQIANGQVTDQMRVRIVLADGRETYLHVAGTPSSIPVGSDDFLPTIPASSVIADVSTMRLAWNADVPSADLVHMQGFWVFTTNAFHYVDWHVVLPATATGVQLPALGDVRVQPPDGTGPQYEMTFWRQYVDADGAAGFVEAVANGLQFTRSDVAVPVPISVTAPRTRVTTARAN